MNAPRAWAPVGSTATVTAAAVQVMPCELAQRCIEIATRLATDALAPSTRDVLLRAAARGSTNGQTPSRPVEGDASAA